MPNKLNKKLRKVAKNREQLYLEAQNSFISEQRRILRDENEEPRDKRKFATITSLFGSFSRTKPKKYKNLYYKTLSRNHILDVSDQSTGSPLNFFDDGVESNIVTSVKDPQLEKKNLQEIKNYLNNMKTNKRSVKFTIDSIKSITSRSTDVAAAVSVIKFILKKHLDEPYLFESEIVQSYSEWDYVVKFWSPLLEKVFRKSGVIPHWGDTKPNFLTSLGIHMKMDLRLIAVPASKFLSDNGYGEFANLVSEPKYYKDKRKVVIASKALLNTIITKNQTPNYEDIYIPYVIVMGFEMHLCFLYLKTNKLYITKKLRTISFPTTLNNFPEVADELVNGLLNLLEMCLTVKTMFNKGAKRKSMDEILGASSSKLRNVDCISKVIWDEVDDDSMDDDSSDSDNSSSVGTDDDDDNTDK